MRRHKIRAVRGYKRPRPLAGRPSLIAPNRLQQAFTVDAPNKVWVTDITYIRTWQGWLYLALVLDLYARKVVGWSMKPTLSRELALDALRSWQSGAASPTGLSWCIPTRAPSTAATTSNGSAPPTCSKPACADAATAGTTRSPILLQQPEKGAHPKTRLQDPRLGACGCLRLYRDILQPNPPPQPSRRHQSRRVRTRVGVRLGFVHQTGDRPKNAPPQADADILQLLPRHAVPITFAPRHY